MLKYSAAIVVGMVSVASCASKPTDQSLGGRPGQPGSSVAPSLASVSDADPNLLDSAKNPVDCIQARYGNQIRVLAPNRLQYAQFAEAPGAGIVWPKGISVDRSLDSGQAVFFASISEFLFLETQLSKEPLSLAGQSVPNWLNARDAIDRRHKGQFKLDQIPWTSGGYGRARLRSGQMQEYPCLVFPYRNVGGTSTQFILGHSVCVYSAEQMQALVNGPLHGTVPSKMLEYVIERLRTSPSD